LSQHDQEIDIYRSQKRGLKLRNENNCAPKPGATIDRAAPNEEGAVDVECVVHDASRICSAGLNHQNDLISERWHRPYAEALIEAEQARRSHLIVEAEHAIFSRYLELCDCPGPIEYSRDLQNAIDVLVQMKKRDGTSF
jgi:hypothetical protein